MRRRPGISYSGTGSPTGRRRPLPGGNRHPAVDVVVLIGLLIATALNWSWPWGLLFIFWSVPALRSGETLLVRPLYRDERPVLFWTVTVLWVAFGAMMVLVDAAPPALEGLFGSTRGS